MTIEAICEEELKALYDTRLRADFPPDELRPYSNMEYLLQRGMYRCLAFREQKETAAYALFIHTEGAALLDYFAVDPALRGQGVGSRFLSELKHVSSEFKVSYVLIEVESLESAETPEQTLERQRRLRFYQNCGCVPTEVYSFVFGVEYQILLLPLQEGAAPTPEEVRASLEKLYRIFITPLVGGDEAAYQKVCRCFFRSQAERPRSFAKDLGRSLTFLYRNRRRFMDERLRQYGFSGAMYMMLLHVDRHPGATQDSIATHMYIDKSNVARRIKQLEELGYIHRETDLSDRRQNNLYLTEQGRKLVPVIRTHLSEWGQSVASGLTEEEQETLLQLLAKIRK